ncbi:MAG: hypothetical protein JXR25_10510 [Pontiellaceae bacterium]|nr:hypothetical protein [Pontiellaceae bacterium]MBN2785251.1 hypothetical protein [Pontiellaceae bacterium]
MRAYKMIGWWTVAVMAIAASVPAQQNKIQDQDLLELLNKVNEAELEKAEVIEAAAKPPLMRAVDVVETSDELVKEVDVVLAEVSDEDRTDAVEVSVEDAPGLDELDMTTVSDEVVASTTDNLISVRLSKVSLEDAINLFAQLSGANIIVPELSEASQVSVNLRNVEWRPALQSILDTYDYELYQRVSGSNVYSVRRRPDGAPEPQVVETFVLKYATVPNAAELIRQLLPPEAKVSEFASRNMLVVKSTESSLGEVRAVLESIDTVRQQVYIESKFMELTDDAQKDLGIDWSVLQAYSAGTAGETTQDYSREKSTSRSSTALYDANGLPYEEASGYVNQGQRLPGSGISTLEGLTPTVQDATSKATSKVLTSVLSADEFRLVLSALEQNKGVNIVSNPKIIVANEEPANISIIRKEPNLKQERQQAMNDTPDTITFTLDPDLKFFEYGIKLDVVPSINTSSNITVQIKPSLTRKFGDKQAGDNTYPIIDEKSIETIFNLASGQTAAIGGLTEVTESEEEHKVPLLGSLPLIGRLFSWNQTVRGQDETIIFVTVGLANTQDINEETGMPGDAELARRQVIEDLNSRRLRDQGREYYQAEQDDKLNDMLKALKRNEEARIEKRDLLLQKEAEKEAQARAKEEAKEKELAALN